MLPNLCPRCGSSQALFLEDGELVCASCGLQIRQIRSIPAPSFAELFPPFPSIISLVMGGNLLEAPRSMPSEGGTMSLVLEITPQKGDARTYRTFGIVQEGQSESQIAQELFLTVMDHLKAENR